MKNSYFENLFVSVGTVLLVIFFTAALTATSMLMFANSLSIKELFLISRISFLVMTLGAMFIFQTVLKEKLHFFIPKSKLKQGINLLMIIMALFTALLAMKTHSSNALIYFLLSFLITSIGEELLFRGLIEMHLKKEFSPIMSLLIQAVLFAVLGHMNFDLLTNLLLRFPLGIIMSIVRNYTKSYSSSIALHFIYDTSVSVFL